MSSIQNARIQNVVQRCKESTKEQVLVLYPAVGYALIAECSKKTFNPPETYVATRECLKKGEYDILEIFATPITKICLTPHYRGISITVKTR
jgi:hypothetical protein